jgi:hypothetical protein
MNMHVEHLQEIKWISFTISLNPKQEEKVVVPVAAIANEDMPAKAAKDAHDAGNANAALVEVATCFMAPMQPHPLCVWPATVKFHARHLAQHRTKQNQFAGL